MFSYVLHKFHKHFMCAEQLWNLRIFLLGIPVVVLHGLFVKLGQNISEKMGDINLFLIWIQAQVKTFENLKKSQNDVYQRLLRRLKKQNATVLKSRSQKSPVKSCPKELKNQQKCHKNGSKRPPNWGNFVAKCLCCKQFQKQWI